MSTNNGKPNCPVLWASLDEAIGSAVRAWARLEHSLSNAFAITLGLEYERADRIFFSALSFNGKRDMLKAALDTSNFTDPSHIETKRFAVFKAANAKAERYKSVRNALAHERPILVFLGDKFMGSFVVKHIYLSNLAMTRNKSLQQIASVQPPNHLGGCQRFLFPLKENDPSSLERLLLEVRQLPPIPYLDLPDTHVSEAP